MITRIDREAILVALIFSLLLIGCNAPVGPMVSLTPSPVHTPIPLTPTIAWKSLTITLSYNPGLTTGCTHELTIDGDGRVVFEGKERCRVIGTVKTTLSTDRILALVAALQETDYFSLSDYYAHPEYTDGPIITTTMTLDGRSKTVVHYDGDKAAPQRLTALENNIYEIVDARQWIIP